MPEVNHSDTEHGHSKAAPDYENTWHEEALWGRLWMYLFYKMLQKQTPSVRKQTL